MVPTPTTFTGNYAASYGAGMYNFDGSSPALTGCVFVGNTAEVYGGGVFNYRASSPVIAGCTFRGNLATGGGGLAGFDMYSTLLGCTFSGNFAHESGGGMACTNSSPVLIGCTFDSNLVGGEGAGVYSEFSSPRLTNCAFSGNSAGAGGGAVANLSSPASFTNCTLTANSAGSHGGGAIYSAGASPQVTNCIVAGNTTAAPDGAQIHHAGTSGQTVVRHSLVEGGWPGAGNVDADPLFVRAPSPGADGRWATKADPSPDDDFGDLRLRPGSPAVDAGDTAAVPPGVITDLDGRHRVLGAAVDLGVYEQPADAAVYQAEGGMGVGARMKNSNVGYTGSGYMDYGKRIGDSLELTVPAAAAGPHLITIRYANGGSRDRPLELSVNGQPVGAPVSFPGTGSWRAWGTVTVPATLAAGNNVLRLSSTTAGGPNVDSLSLQFAAPGTAAHQAESATMVGALARSNHTGYTGSGFADYQRATGDSVEFTIDVPSDGAYALDFRYANGGASDRPLELRVDGETVGGPVSFAPTGSWRAWHSATQSVPLTAGRHQVRLTTVGQNGPNLDALTVRPLPPPPDTTAPRVVGVSVQNNEVLPPGDATIVVRFSEPMKVSNLSPFDVYPDSATYEGRWPESMSYDETGTVLTIHLADLRDDFTVIGFNTEDDGFVDVAGNRLDGEPLAFPIPPNVTGDGVAGGDFYFNYYVDSPTPVPLALPDPLPPGGATVVAESVLRGPGPDADTDSFTIDLKAGQTLRANVSDLVDLMFWDMKPAIELRDPSGALIASATGELGNPEVNLPAVTAQSTGTYTLTVASALGRVGAFRATVQVAGPSA